MLNFKEEINSLKKMPNKVQEMGDFDGDDYKVYSLSEIEDLKKNKDKIALQKAPPKDQKKSGRARLNIEDKAKPITIKLHSDHLEKLEFVSGAGNAEKVRNLLDSHTSFIQREKRQVEEIRRRIKSCADAARKSYLPAETNEQKALQKKYRDHFATSFENLEALFNLFHFEINDLTPHLSRKDKIDLDICFFVAHANA